MPHPSFKTLLAGAIVAGLVAPGPALAFRALNHLEVRPVSQTAFEVLQSGGTSAADFWCAAGDFARRKLGAAANQRVYLLRPKQVATTRANRNAVTFSLVAPPEAAQITTKSLTLSITTIGESLSASFAQQYCYDRLGPERRLFP